MSAMVVNESGGARGARAAPTRQAAPAPSPGFRIDPTAIYTQDDAIPILGSREKQKRLRRQSSDLEFCRIGQNVFYRGAALLRFLEARAQRSTSGRPGAGLVGGSHQERAP